MQSALIGGGVGVIGLLIGAVLALWWKGKASKAKGQSALLSLRLKVEEKEHEETLKLAQDNAATAERQDEVIAEYKRRLKEARDRQYANRSLHDLVDLANSRRVSKDGSGGETSKSGSGETVSGEREPTT